jgi:hypothetical protein
MPLLSWAEGVFSSLEGCVLRVWGSIDGRQQTQGPIFYVFDAIETGYCIHTKQTKNVFTLVAKKQKKNH